MKVLIIESCAGSDFVYSSGQTIESSDPVVIEHLKDLIKGELATEVKGEKVERAVRDIEKVEKR
jgi:Ni2+-binding GTPase involved in maturation of urease and hydrogenase